MTRNTPLAARAGVLSPAIPGSAPLAAAVVRPALLLAAALCAALAPAQALAQTRVSAPDGSWSLTLPSDWVRIPALELYLREHPGASGPLSPEDFARFKTSRDAFQRQAEGWFVLPWLLVSLDDKRRTTQDLFMDHVLAERDHESDADRNGARFLDKEHEPGKRMHHYSTSGYDPVAGRRVRTTVYTFLTARGFLRLTWRVGEEQYPALEDAVRRASQSLTLSPQLQYQQEKRP